MPRKFSSRRASFATLGGTIALLASGDISAAQPGVEQFYKAKTINLIVGYPAGGGNDVTARLVTRHLPKYLPGAPLIVLRNMPGAGSLLAANHIYAAAPKDGTVIGLFSPFVPLLAQVGAPQVRFDASKFHYLGRMQTGVYPLMVWHTQPYASWRDALTQEITLSATGAGSPPSVYPTMLNKVMKTKFRVVMGYKGSGEAMLAMERGETAGHSSGWTSINLQHPNWISEGKVRFLLQFALNRLSAMKGVPTAYEIAETDEQRSILRAVLSTTEFSSAFLTTPGAPPERVEALRRAFERMMASEEFIIDSKKAQVFLDPLSGERLQQMIGELGNTPPEIIEKVKAAYGGS